MEELAKEKETRLLDCENGSQVSEIKENISKIELPFEVGENEEYYIEQLGKIK